MNKEQETLRVILNWLYAFGLYVKYKGGFDIAYEKEGRIDSF